MPNGESTQYVSTKATHKHVLKWMMTTATRDGEVGFMGKYLKEFPQCFQHKSYHANITKAWKWWKRRAEFFRQLEEERNYLSMVRSCIGFRRRLDLKALFDRGRKRAPWVLWLHEELKGEFLRLKVAGVKFSAKLLISLAKDIFTTSHHPQLSPHLKDPRSGKCLLNLVNFSWIQAFMVSFNIVEKTKTGKLLSSPIKQAYIEQMWHILWEN